ncbi:MAG: leucine-rich repeat protein [Clostridia bacterium]|nr:leucine-rich repeat protein [Clostridia bacterium]
MNTKKKLIDIIGEDEYQMCLDLGRQIIHCPICGNETFNDWFICPHCNWEAEVLHSEDEYSPANKSTIAEYRKKYISENYLIEDGVIFSKDKKIIVKYNKQGETRYTIPDSVTEIAEECFADAKELIRIDIGKNVTKIGNRGLQSDGLFNRKTIYIPPTVTELESEIFDVGGDDGGLYYPISVVGGARGSIIEEYCNERNIDFIEVDEDEVEHFYAASEDELCQKIREQIECETEFFIDESDKGYRIRFAYGVLIIVASSWRNTMTDIIVKNSNRKINRYRREKVEKIIIGNHITELADLAFDDYPNLKSVHIGANVQKISPAAFSGKNHSYSYGCQNLESITVDENNKWYVAEDDVLYTNDYETLVKYCPAKPQLYYEVDSRVRYIERLAFEYAKNLQCLKVGDNCISIGKSAFINTLKLRHVYFAAGVEGFPDDTYPFFVQVYGFECPYIDNEIVIGGAGRSAAQKYCDKHGLRFHVIEEDEIEDFMKTPLPDENVDKYLLAFQKIIVVDENGNVIQLGEFADKLIFPEGVIAINDPDDRINLSQCKRVVIPSTMTCILSECFDGPTPDLEEFIVSEENPKYVAIEGHLCSREGELLTYAPGAVEVQGVLPKSISSIGESAFQLSDGPFEKLCIPSSVTNIEPQFKWGGLFYEAEVSPDNPNYKSVDGSIFTKDGKKLVHAKISEDFYTIPDRTEVLGVFALSDVKGTVLIPASITEVEEHFPVCYYGVVVRVPRGSYMEQYAKEKMRHVRLEIIENGEVVETLEPPEQIISFSGLAF